MYQLVNMKLRRGCFSVVGKVVMNVNKVHHYNQLDSCYTSH